MYYFPLFNIILIIHVCGAQSVFMWLSIKKKIMAQHFKETLKCWAITKLDKKYQHGLKIFFSRNKCSAFFNIIKWKRKYWIRIVTSFEGSLFDNNCQSEIIDWPYYENYLDLDIFLLVEGIKKSNSFRSILNIKITIFLCFDSFSAR